MSYEHNKITSIDLLNQDRPITDENISNAFINFINNFSFDDSTYYSTLCTNITQGFMHLQIQLDHINTFDESLYMELMKDPFKCVEIFEIALSNLSMNTKVNLQIIIDGPGIKLREIKSCKANKIIKISGIVISASAVYTKPKKIFMECRSCSHQFTSNEIIPRRCQSNAFSKNALEECPLDPYIVVPEKSTLIDIQYLKIQEAFEDIPIGETPRHFSLQVVQSLVNHVSPGCKVKLTGILLHKNNKQFMHVLGIENEKTKIKKAFSDAEEAIFRRVAAEGNIYTRISKSIAPSIFGKDEVKKALATMLFGGTRKVNSDGISLRGDINILLLGDPGIAKSQFLKFIEQVSPISVYTSGRGSSAAGLTAAVSKDKNVGFYLEGGALVLADRGVCCIDEFDKMNEGDRVAIHEAMEQQTISIAKAGITTVLNTRTSILAAANPVFGRYDDYKTPAENIEFGSTILSRFDMIFILKDNYSTEDKSTADHILKLHSNGNNTNGNNTSNDHSYDHTNISNSKNIKTIDDDLFTVDFLRNYIQFAKSKCNPILSEEAANKLNRFYIEIRQQVDEFEKESTKKSSVPITVRQLEAIIRISESLARMELTNRVSTSHVDEAIRLFQLSTMNAVSQGHQIEGISRNEYFTRMLEVVERIKEVLPVGSTKKMVDLMKIVGLDENLIRKAINYMIKQKKLVTRDQGKVLIRTP